MSLKTYFTSSEMDLFFTTEYIRTAFAVIDRMNDSDQIWDGWGIDFTGEELADQLIFLLETYY